MTKPQTKEREPALFNEAPQPAPAAKPPAKRQARRAEVTNLPVKAGKTENRAIDLLAAVMSAAADPACQPEKIHALLDVRSRIMREQAEVGYRKAYREAKRRMPKIDKDGKIDEGVSQRTGRAGKKTKYATYENINRVISPILDEVGLDLSLHAEPKPDGVGIIMRATLSYIAVTAYGETVYAESSIVPMPPDPTGSKNPAQATSSALAYAKRNAVILVLNIVSEAPEDKDRDGETRAKRDLRPQAGAASLAQKTDEQVAEESGDDVPKITQAQLDKLAPAIAECKVGVPKFCEHYGISKVKDLPASRFQEAMDACARFKPK